MKKFRLDSSFNSLLLNGIGQLSSLNGSIFIDDQSKMDYLSQLIHTFLCILKMIPTQFNSISQINAQELMGVSRILVRITTNYKFASLVQLPEHIGQFISDLSHFSLHILQLLQKICLSQKEDFDIEELWQDMEECFDLILESWLLLLGDNRSKDIHPYIRECTSRIYQAYTETRLIMARTELEEEDEDDDENQQDYERLRTTIR